jgi:dCMP deaminase
MTERPEWREYFLGIAKAVAARGDCTRRQVGCVIVDEHRRIVSTGYNGAPSKGPSCLAGECPRGSSTVEPGSSYDTGPGACVALHAELNALLYADPVRVRGGAAWITDAPCDACARILKGSGLATACWPEGFVNL